jgi:catechol 2,3-dioxygenase-like lactoylglutathione lyase family enzyme
MRKLLIVFTAFTGLGMAQTAPAGEVVGVGNFLHVVSDSEKAVAFYNGVLGMDVQGAPPNGPRPYLTTPAIVNLYDALGAQYRVGTTLVQGSPMRAELVEWKDIERKPVHRRIQDPGAATMILIVRDLDSIMARVKSSGTPIVTTGGEPVTLAEGKGTERAIIVRDPDGFFVELAQIDPAPQTPAPASSNMLEVGFAFTVSNTDKMMHVFKDALGFQPTTGPFEADPARLKLMGTPGAKYRQTTTRVPGTSLHANFYEFKGIDRQAVHSHSSPRDPGSPMLRLLVRDMDSVVKALAAAGAPVVSHESKPVTLVNPNGTIRAAIVSAPDNLLVQVMQQMPKQ